MPPLREKSSVVSVLNRRGWKGLTARRGAEIPGPWTVVTGCEGNDALNCLRRLTISSTFCEF